MVMVFHFVGHHQEPSAIRQIAVIGQTGVELFFVLSGYLITGILLAAKGSTNYFRTFYARRALRIFPLYYAFLFFFFFVQPVLLNVERSPWNTQIWAWLYLENVLTTFPNVGGGGPTPGHFWSLAVEEHFYLLWPLCVWFFSGRTLWKIVIAGVVVAPILRWIFLSADVPVFYLTPTRFDALGYGALLALLEHSGLKIPRYLFACTALALATLLLPAFAVLSSSGYVWLQVLKLSLIPAFYAALLGFCLFDPLSTGVNRFLSIAPLVWVGSISYGLYVFHIFCISLIAARFSSLPFLPDLILSFGLTFCVAYLSFRFFERPILRQNRRFQYRRVGAPHAGPPSEMVESNAAPTGGG